MSHFAVEFGDFASDVSLESQIKDALKRDFAFKNYNEKIKLIVEILGKKSSNTRELNTIRKHVLIRNAVQHHSGVAYSDMFKLLGSSSMEIMDRHGKAQTVIPHLILELKQCDPVNI